MSLPKPSKKILILLATALTVIIIITVNKFYPTEIPVAKVEQFQNTQLEPIQKTEVALLDTDKDGLPEWQEVITGTDPKKADTDNDGTNDGDELKQGRDPKVQGPDDHLDNISVATSTKSNKEDTVSDTVARNLFANAVYMSNNGEITEDSKQALVNNLVSGIQKSFTFKEYGADGLVVIPIENSDNIRFYTSNLATFQIGMILQMQKNISKIENDVGVLGQIYAEQANDLYALQVPASLKDIHLKIVNNYSKGAAVFEAIANEKKDPMKLPFAIKTYQDITADQPQLLKQIAQFVRDNDIIFTSNEVGGYWNAFE